MILTCPLQKIHFIGIGGIGMSAIAEMLLDLGFAVQGSDAKESANTQRLRQNGIPVFIGHDASHIVDVDAVVISSAITEKNPELAEARLRRLPIGHRSEMLAEILHYKQSICVSGTHGKTTTSSLVAHVLMSAGLDPSFVIGGILNSERSNARLGKGDYVVVEADESDGSFLKLPTSISIVTNIEPEHMDFYKTFETVKNAYTHFMKSTAFYGVCIACIDHDIVREVVERVDNRRCITFGTKEEADVQARNIRLVSSGQVFDIRIRTDDGVRYIKDVCLSMIGRHNILNALGAVCVGLYLGISDDIIQKALASFEGIQRRLTYRGTLNSVPVYDDYGHHPTEIKATLQGIREHIKGKVIAVFQPHRYSRLQDLWDGFLTCFDEADEVYVCDVYSAGEEPLEGITAPAFARVLGLTHSKAVYLPMLEDLVTITHGLTSADAVVCLGAGTISSQTIALLEQFKEK